MFTGQGAIGDTILTLPALAALRARYPGCEVTFAGNAAMLALMPVEEALSADDRRLLPLFEEPARAWPGADLHVIFARQPAGLPGIRCDPLEAVLRGVHVADWLVDAVDAHAGARQPVLEVEAGAGVELVIHPGAGSAAKRWPIERFAALAEALGSRLAIVHGPADPAFELAYPHELWDNLPLPELAGRDTRAAGCSSATTPALPILRRRLARQPSPLIRPDPAIWGIRGDHARRLAGEVSVSQAAATCRELMATIARTA